VNPKQKGLKCDNCAGTSTQYAKLALDKGTWEYLELRNLTE